MKKLERFTINLGASKVVRNLPYHFIIMAIIPPLSLLANNLGEMNVVDTWRVFLFSLVFGTSIFLFYFGFFRSAAKANISTFATLFVFSIIVPLFQVVTHATGEASTSKTLLIVVAVQFLVSVIWFLKRDKLALFRAAQMLNVISLAMLVVPGIQSLNYFIEAGKNGSLLAGQTNTTNIEIGEAKQNSPDVYFIVLDSYGRSDRIEQEFDYDNSKFLESLEIMGFYIADCSLANYSNTEFSIASTLNMAYVARPGNSDELINPLGLIQQSRVIQFFQEAGYQFVSFETPYLFINFEHADVFYPTTVSNDSFSLTEFERLYIKQTPLGSFDDAAYLVPFLFSLQGFQNKGIRVFGADYDSDIQILENLERASVEVPSPKFVYAHIIAPHPPFVFNPDGSYTDNGYQFKMDIVGDFYVQGYSNEVRYLDNILPELVQQIRYNSDTDPIIIIQGDHGFNIQPIEDTSMLESRLAILNAMYLPDVDSDNLFHPTISPVNTFRIVLNQYFGGDLELFPDDSYYVSGEEIEVYETTRPCRE